MTGLLRMERAGVATAFALLASPAMIIFLSSNFVNVGNLAFNMIFSRLMGPDMFGDLAVVLTIKLALLGVLGALSSAVSHRIAEHGPLGLTQTEQALARINRLCFVGLWLALPLTIAALLYTAVDARLHLSSPFLLVILLVSLPFCAPLNILRGVALGRMDSRKIVVSANVEMAVRLALSVAAWQVGLGIEGVVVAIVLSIVAGWVVLADMLPKPYISAVDLRPMATSLGIAMLPFGLLQLSQVASLDGDIFLATRFLGDTETGHVAALSLFQRIQFFACFALAGVLLPSIVTAQRDGKPYASTVLTIAGLLAAVSCTVLTLTWAYPEALLHALVGQEYVVVAPYLWQVALAAILFTVNYLFATFLIAIKYTSGVAVVVVGAAVQIALMIYALNATDGGMSAMFTSKLLCQLSIFLILAQKIRQVLQFSTPIKEDKND